MIFQEAALHKKVSVALRGLSVCSKRISSWAVLRLSGWHRLLVCTGSPTPAILTYVVNMFIMMLLVCAVTDQVFVLLNLRKGSFSLS